ncbi:MAG: Dabb family protein [Vicinamibacterales bacterium]
MLVHLLLMQPKPDVPAAARRALLDAYRAAVAQIPSIRRARVGRRARLGYGYEQGQPDFQYGLLLEFDDREGLAAYLAHPAHADLAARFYEVTGNALILDLELSEGADSVLLADLA